jgi:low affinity Fe/Cu permease
MTDGRFAQLYAKARGSTAFLVGLCVFAAVWISLSAITGFDSDHGLINLILSLEASISLAFFALVGEKQYQATMEMLKKIDAVLESVKSEEDDILEEVKK